MAKPTNKTGGKKPGSTTQASATQPPRPGTPPKPELAPVPNSPPPSLVKPAQKVEPGLMLRKKDLLERVAAEAGVKKPEAKPIVEAMLAVMGQALSDGEQLNLQPFGKVKVQKKKDLANGQALTLKLRRSSQSLDETEGLADPDTDS